MSDGSRYVNLELFGADKRRFPFPPSPLSKALAVEDAGEGGGDPMPLDGESPAPPPNEQSAGALLRRLADVIAAWRLQLPSDAQPALIAILHGGLQVDVERLSHAGAHDILIEGSTDFQRGSQSLTLTNWAMAQFMVYVKTIHAPIPVQNSQQAHDGRPQRLIGFVIDGEAFDA